MPNVFNRLKITDSLARWMVPPASSWRYKSQSGLSSAGLLQPLQLLALTCVLSMVLMLALAFMPEYLYWWLSALGGLLLTAFLLIQIIIYRTEQHLIFPLTHLRHWAARMRGGNLLARLPENTEGEFSDLARDINTLGERLHSLTQDMANQVKIQTEKVAQKSNSLQILYDVATSINSSNNLDGLLQQFLHTLKDVVHAEAASVRILSADGNLHLAAGIGLHGNIAEKEMTVPVDRCQCGAAVLERNIQCQDIKQCDKLNKTPLFEQNNLKVIAVPLQYRGEVLGIYNLFVQKTELIEREEITGLLNSIGKQLGMAIAKSKLEEQTRRLALMEERTLLSHELHDSLAQTIASLRFQVKMLDDTLKSNDSDKIQSEVTRLEQGLDEANNDLRELLDHFRTRMDERGLIPALKELTSRLEKETGISVYFQDETRQQTLQPGHEVQVLHIVQEALSNVRKHSGAQNARVMLKANTKGEWHILIEDDGTGISQTKTQSSPGENIGMNIMRERTKHLNGELNIESDANEGTRVELTFCSKASPVKGSIAKVQIYPSSATEIHHKNIVH